MDGVVDIELKLLLEGILLRYRHDFRDYAVASLRRRIRQAAMLGIILTGAAAGAAHAVMPAAALRLAGADRVLDIGQIAAGLARLGSTTGSSTRAAARSKDDT